MASLDPAEISDMYPSASCNLLLGEAKPLAQRAKMHAKGDEKDVQHNLSV